MAVPYLESPSILSSYILIHIIVRLRWWPGIGSPIDLRSDFVIKFFRRLRRLKNFWNKEFIHLYRIYPVPNLSFIGFCFFKRLKQSNKECNDVYRIHLVPNLSCTEFWSYVKCWKIKIVCIFLYRIYHVPNLSCTEFSMYRIYHVPNLAYTEFIMYRILTLQKG